jgi:WD40 repeat protein
MNNKKIILIYLLVVIFAYKLNAQKKNPEIHFGNQNSLVYDICFSESGNALFVAEDNIINVYSTETQELITQFDIEHTKQVMSIDISNDSSIFVSGGKDSLIVIWDLLNGGIKKKLSYHNGIVTSVKISSDNRLIVSGSTDNKVIVYDIIDEKILYTLSDHKEDITAVDFNPNGKILASSSGDNNINLYNLKNGELITTLSEHKDWVRDISFSPDSSKLISCGDDSKVIIWNIDNLDNIKSTVLKQGFKWLLSSNFNNNSDAYVVAGLSGKIKIYTRFAEVRYNLKAPINKVIFASDESQLKIAMATRGKGVILLYSKYMKIKD